MGSTKKQAEQDAARRALERLTTAAATGREADALTGGDRGGTKPRHEHAHSSTSASGACGRALLRLQLPTVPEALASLLVLVVVALFLHHLCVAAVSDSV